MFVIVNSPSAKAAGFKNIHTVDEPTAAATCYVIENKSYYDKKVKAEGINDDENGKFLSFTALVADFGGGTSDFSKIDINGSLAPGEDTVRYELAGRNITGIPQFGGQDITKSIQKDFLEQIKQSMGKKWDKLESEDIDEIELSLLKEAETVKHFLCNNVSHKRRFRFQKVNYELIMTQSRLKYINSDHIDSITKQVTDCIDGDNIDQLFFVGGSSEIPFIVETVKQLVSDKCDVVRINNKRNLVARGASIIQYIRNQSDPIISFQQINSFNLGFGCLDGTMVPLIQRGDSIPYYMTNPRNFKNPDASQHCWLNIYEGISIFTEQCTFIGSSKIDFGKVYDARTFDMKVTAELDNHGIFKTTVKPSSDPLKIIGTYTMDLGSQGKFGCESIEKKEEFAQIRKQFQEEKRKIDNYQDQYFHLLNKLNEFDTDSNLIRKWHKWRMSIGSLNEWEELIQSMSAILKTYENSNDSNDEPDSDLESDGMSIIDDSQISLNPSNNDADNDLNQSQEDNDDNHDKNEKIKKSIQNKHIVSVKTDTKKTSDDEQTVTQNKSSSDNNHNTNVTNKKTVHFPEPITDSSSVNEPMDVDQCDVESKTESNTISEERTTKRRSKRIADIQRY